MADATLIERELDKQILAEQQRFHKAMRNRLKGMSLESKERYYAVLSSLVTKLEIPHKPLREVLQEVIVESAPHITQELSAG